MQHVTTPSYVPDNTAAEQLIDQILAATTSHEVLQLDGSGSIADARMSYKKIARIVHPDKTSDARAKTAFERVHEAMQAIVSAACAHETNNQTRGTSSAQNEPQQQPTRTWHQQQPRHQPPRQQARHHPQDVPPATHAGASSKQAQQQSVPQQQAQAKRSNPPTSG